MDGKLKKNKLSQYAIQEMLNYYKPKLIFKQIKIILNSSVKEQPMTQTELTLYKEIDVLCKETLLKE